jgi:hypothetical protein
MAWLIFNTCCALVLPFIELLAHCGRPLRMARSAATAAKDATVRDGHNRTLTAAASAATLHASEASDHSIVDKSSAAPGKLNNKGSACSDNVFMRMWKFYVPPMSKTAAVYLTLFLVWEFLAFWLPLKRRLLNTKGIRQPGYSSYYRQVCTASSRVPCQC